jgi:RimJ/RimL family protein N-acetyltransferase
MIFMFLFSKGLFHVNQPYRLPDEFKTARYRLRRATVDDADGIFCNYATDPEVTRFLGWHPHKDMAETKAFLEGVTVEWDQGTGFPLIAFSLEYPDQVIGMFHSHLTGTRVSFGYVLRASIWGNGCASEVMSWLVEHALSHPAIFRAEAFCDVENIASARVMEKAGMIREGVLRRYFNHPNISDMPRDCLMYSKVR